jgi:O-antigen/teichoic acid export membrane protein
LAVKQALVMAGVAVLWLLVGRYAIVLLLGAKCADSFWSSVVLVLGGIPFAFSAAAAQAMLVLDRVRVNFCAGLILLVGTVAGMYIFTPPLGALGAAIAMTLAQLAGTLFSVIVAMTILRRLAARAGDVAATPGSEEGVR